MGITLIGSGAVKLVWALEGDDKHVFCTPQRLPLLHIALPWCRAELKKEVDTTRKIQEALQKANRSPEHLAVSLKKSEKSIHGHFTVETERATGDLETVIKRADLSFATRLQLGEQAFEGFSALHAAGYLHGDLKPENILVYETAPQQLTLKISDWGKARQVLPEHTARYTGNTRFAPHEYHTSYPGEVFGMGLTLLRILEEALLSQSPEQDMLIKPPKTRALFAEKKYRGFIKYIFSHVDSYYPLIACIHRIKAWWYRNFPHAYETKKKKNQELTHLYVDELARRLIQQGFCSDAVAGKLACLIKQMTLLDPSQRPTSQKAYETLQTISEQHLQEQRPAPSPERPVWAPVALLRASLGYIKAAASFLPFRAVLGCHSGGSQC